MVIFMTDTPTPAQIAQVQSNLTNMQAFNDYVYNQGGSSRITNAYLLMTIQDNNDLGLNIGLNLMEGMFWAVGGMLGPIGNFAASFLSGMLSYWADSENTPPSLNQTFASLFLRIQAQSLAVDTALATYYQDVAGNWGTSFTYNGTTCTMEDLSTFQFPAETDPEFEKMAAASIFALDQYIWSTVMKINYVVTLWELTSGPTIFPGSEGDPPVSWDEMFIQKNPAYYNTWSWHNSSGCGDTTGWEINEYNLGTGAGVFTDGSMSNEACAYLFIDSADGVVINENGLYARATVFNNLGLRTATQIVNDSGPTGEKLSVGYLRAMAEHRTLGTLILREGRDKVQQSIIDKAHEDPVFARDVVARPRQTLEAFLGVKIPETIALTVIGESPRKFGIVIPIKKSE